MATKSRRTPESLFRALADQTRLRILNLIGDSEVCVCYFVETLRVAQPKISRHLAYLRKVGLVETRKEGIWVHYKLTRFSDPHEERIVREALAWIEQSPVAHQDKKRFSTACCNPNRFESLQGAPAPKPTCTAARM